MRNLVDRRLDSFHAVHGGSESVRGSEDFIIDSPLESASKNPANDDPTYEWAWASGRRNFDWMDHHGPFENGE